MKSVPLKYLVFGLVSAAILVSFLPLMSPWQQASGSSGNIQWKKIFFALNLRNNEDLIPGMTDRFDKLFDLLSHEVDMIYFSIFSNNNNDATDDMITKYFGELFARRNIPNTIVTNGTTCGGYSSPPPGMNRIDWLACVRNSAMEPLYKSEIFSRAHNFNDTLVLFFNDIVFEPDDIVSLIRTENGNFDLACGLDFYYNFYDIWVTRGIDGKYFSAFPPFAMDFGSAVAILKSTSPIIGSSYDGVPVQCCWNGVAAIRASKFTQDKIRFRSEISRECNTMQSECKLFCEDLGRDAKVFINPNVIVTYNEWMFVMNKLIRNFYIYLIFVIFRIFEFRFNTSDDLKSGGGGGVMQCEGETKTSLLSIVWFVFVLITIVGLFTLVIIRKKFNYRIV